MHDWPKWLTGDNESVRDSLVRIGRAKAALDIATAETTVVRLFAREQIDQPIEHLESLGAFASGPDDDFVAGWAFKQGYKLPRSYTAAFLSAWQGDHVAIRHHFAAVRLAIARLLNGFCLGVQSGDILVPLILLRSVLEQIAVANSAVVFLRSKPEQTEFASAKKTFLEIRNGLRKKTHGTRVSWTKIHTTPAEIPLSKDALAYRNKGDKSVDRKAESMLNAIDGLDKEIADVRAVYEILCEFAHPNVGISMAFTKPYGPVSDRNGVVWHEHHLKSGPAASFLDATGDTLPRVLRVCAECLEKFEHVATEAREQEMKLLRLTQVIVRHYLAEYRPVLEPYESCPCGSGKKYKRCCSTAGIVFKKGRT